MTNAEAAAHFASMPADRPAMVLNINGDTGTGESQILNPPGTNLDEVDEETLDDEDKTLVTTYTKW